MWLLIVLAGLSLYYASSNSLFTTTNNWLLCSLFKKLQSSFNQRNALEQSSHTVWGEMAILTFGFHFPPSLIFYFGSFEFVLPFICNYSWATWKVFILYFRKLHSTVTTRARESKRQMLTDESCYLSAIFILLFKGQPIDQLGLMQILKHQRSNLDSS